MAKSIVYFFLIYLVSGCVSAPTTYRFAFGPRKELYTEKFGRPIDAALAEQLGGTVSTVSGDRNQAQAWTSGYQLGISEELASGFVSTIHFFYNKYEDINYSFESSVYGPFSQYLQTEGAGLEASIGYRWRWLRPNISYKIENISTSSIVTGGVPATSASQNGNIFVWGGGLALDIPLASWLYLVLQADYRAPTKRGDDGTKSSYQSYQINLLVGNLKVGGPERGRSSSRKK